MPRAAGPGSWPVTAPLAVSSQGLLCVPRELWSLFFSLLGHHSVGQAPPYRLLFNCLLRVPSLDTVTPGLGLQGKNWGENSSGCNT